MVAEELVRDTYSVPRQARDARSLFGGVRLNSRITLFFFFGLLAIIIMGGVFYLADQRMSRAIINLKSSDDISALVNRINTMVITLKSDGHRFVTSRKPEFAETYARKSGDIATVLIRLRGMPAALDAQKLVITLDDGINQHASHFQNIVRLQSILGKDDNDGLRGNAAVSGDLLERGLRDFPALNLSAEMAALRKMQLDLHSRITAEIVGAITDALNNLRQSVMAHTMPAQSKKTLNQRIKSYAADMDQLTKTRLIQSAEILRLDEVAAYISPNLTALLKFSVNLDETTNISMESSRTEVRRILVSGGLIILLSLMLIGTLLIRSIAYPVTELANAAVQLARGNRSINIPVLANYDETGDVANALIVFRENMVQSDRLRQELEVHLKNAEKSAGTPNIPASAPKEPENARPSPIARAPISPPPISEILQTPLSNSKNPQAGNIDPMSGDDIQSDQSKGVLTESTELSQTPLSKFSQQVAQTSQNASSAAKDAEQCDFMVGGLAESIEKIDDTELLLTSIGDQMSLLAVQVGLFSEMRPDDSENLVMLSGQQIGENEDRPNSPSVNDRIETLQNGTKRAVRSIQQIGKMIEDVNRVALIFAADASNHALEAATELLRQSEDLRGMLDDLLGRIKSDEQAGAGS